MLSAYPTLRFRGSGSLYIIIGTLAACALPISIGVMFLLNSLEGFSSIELWIDHLRGPNSDAMIFDIPVIGIFTLGTICVALLSTRSIAAIKHLQMQDVILVTLRNAGLVHGITALSQIVIMGSSNFADIALLFFFGGFIHLGMFAVIAAPLSLVCAYIFRMIALTQKPAHLTSTFD